MPLSIEDQIREDLELAEQLAKTNSTSLNDSHTGKLSSFDLNNTTIGQHKMANGADNQDPKKMDKKRKRQEEQAWKKVIKRKIQEEEDRITVEEEKSFQSNRELYALFNDLQGISQDFNISFETPELVVVGNQSDGKSSFVEGLLGFQFNIVASNIGTRRPLIIQMVNNPTMTNPSCKFRKERLVSEGEDPFEEEETPIENISEEIESRTNALCGSGDTVSAVPIILRVEYSQCANLTIWDMPGFRHGGEKKLSQQILMLSERVMSMKNRIIICVEQSTTEWANSSSRPIVRKLDPDFSRTVLINTKFDNRVKELRTKEEAHKYLNGEGLPLNKKPFFISLPVDRNLDHKEFKSSIRECYLSDYQSLLKTKFDETKYLPQIGFYKTKQFLEKLLSEKYHQSLRPTLLTLENICSKTTSEIQRIEREIKSNNLDALKEKSIDYVQTFVQVIEKLLEGSIFGDPDKYGQTLIEERLDSAIPDWPNFSLKYDIINQDIKLYGGAQYQRLMNEFEYVAHSTEFPPTSVHEVATSLGIGKSHTAPVFEIAASNIVKIKARSSLLPLISIVLKRCSYILARLLDIAISVIQAEAPLDEQPNEHFLTELGKVYQQFVEEVEKKCKQKMDDDFDTFTKVIDWDLLNGYNEETGYNYLKPSQEETRNRVIQIMEHTSLSDSMTDGKLKSENLYDQVRILSARLFARIRFFFIKLIKNKFNAFFLEPIFEKLGSFLTNYFRKLSDSDYENIFKLGVKSKAEKLHYLKIQLSKCEREKNRFKELYTKVRRDLDEKRESQ